MSVNSIYTSTMYDSSWSATAPTTYTIANSNGNITNSHTLTITGDIKLNGESLEDRLSRIENLLHIPPRDIALEQKYSRLRDLWNEYNEELSACKTWEILKNSK